MRTMTVCTKLAVRTFQADDLFAGFGLVIDKITRIRGRLNLPPTDARPAMLGGMHAVVSGFAATVCSVCGYARGSKRRSPEEVVASFDCNSEHPAEHMFVLSADL